MELSPIATIGIILVVGGLLLWEQNRRTKNHGRIPGASKSILESYTQDLTKEAKEQNLDPVIGREEEIERVIHILSRRRKNNPLLLGEPGVGKTAIVEGLARRIHKGYIPEPLKDKRVLALDLTGMISGTKYRGEFEERMRQLTTEIESMGRKIILFIDEMHMIEQASGAEGSMNVSDILKPALARGDLQAVGATTWKEYEEFIKPDDALNRRFQPVFVGEPSDEETFEILRGIKGVYEQFHQVQIPDDTLKATITLSKELKGRFLPDKALDLLDEACAKVRIESTYAHVNKGDDTHNEEQTKKRIAQETIRLKEVMKELEELDEEFPDELEIEKAERALKRHLAQLSEHDQIAKNSEGPIVSTDAIRTIVDKWQTKRTS